MEMSRMRAIIEKLPGYISGMVLLWLVILFYRFNPYYENALRPETQATLLYLAVAYSVLSAVLRFIVPDAEKPDGGVFDPAAALLRFLKESIHYVRNFTSDPGCKKPGLMGREKAALLFILVKIYFLPMMINSFYTLSSSVIAAYPEVAGGVPGLFSVRGYTDILFPFMLSIIFLIDTAYFSFGYAVEAGFLKNTIRSVEPTVFGWAVALVCYPPFKGLLSGYTGWHADYMASAAAQTATFAIRIAVVVFLLIYVWATVSLGAKCSNLTNRGIVDRGPYRFVRHPAYTAKNIAWWVTLLPAMSVFVFLSMLTWSFIYYLRAITEERHLIADPDYREYCRKVRWRFIPYVC